MNEAYNNIITRRSIKKYKPDQITKEELELILEAGKWAPSGGNKQSATMIVLQDPEDIKNYEILNGTAVGREKGQLYGAPTVVIVLADKNNPNAAYDGALVMANLQLAANALGVGSCWINRCREAFETEEGKALLKKWGVEGEFVGVGNCILGYQDGPTPKAMPRKENFVYYVK